MSVHIGIAVKNDGKAILWQKAQGGRFQVKPLPFGKWASWTSCESLPDTFLVFSRITNEPCDPNKALELVGTVDLAQVWFDDDDEVVYKL